MLGALVVLGGTALGCGASAARGNDADGATTPVDAAGTMVARTDAGGGSSRDDATPPTDPGDLVSAPPDEVLLRGTGFEASEGHRVYALLENWNGAIQSTRVVGGRFEFRWPGATCTRCYGYLAAVFIDTDGDRRCTTETVYSPSTGDPSRPLLELRSDDGDSARNCMSFAALGD